MRDGVAALALGLVVGITAGPARRAAAMEPGTMIDQGNVDQVKDQLPPEIYNHFKKGEYANKLIDFPNSRWSWDDGFAEAMKWNAEHLVLDEHKSPIDKDTGKRPDYIRGLPFPDIREDDPEAGYKALWNLDYAEAASTAPRCRTCSSSITTGSRSSTRRRRTPRTCSSSSSP